MHDPKATWIRFLGQLELGAPCALPDHGLVLVPLIDPDPQPLDVFPLRWGIEHGRTRVSEVGEGRVDRVRVEHNGATPLLIVDGEEVRGARQNRVFNASFLVPPSSTTDLPVSCVEEKRWQRGATEFASSGRTVITAVRTTKLRAVATSVIQTGRYDSDQQAVWQGVTRYLSRTRVSSVTRSHAEAADTRQTRVLATLATLHLVPGQVGIAAVDARGQVTIDAFGSPGVLNKTWTVVASGLLCDTEPAPLYRDAPARARRVIDHLIEAQLSCSPAPGLGQSLHVVDDAHVAGALLHEGRVYHLLAGSTSDAC